MADNVKLHISRPKEFPTLEEHEVVSEGLRVTALIWYRPTLFQAIRPLFQNIDSANGGVNIPKYPTIRQLQLRRITPG